MRTKNNHKIKGLAIESMKKIVTILLTIALIGSLAACGNIQSDKSKEELDESEAHKEIEPEAAPHELSEHEQLIKDMLEETGRKYIIGFALEEWEHLDKKYDKEFKLTFEPNTPTDELRWYPVDEPNLIFSVWHDFVWSDDYLETRLARIMNDCIIDNYFSKYGDLDHAVCTASTYFFSEMPFDTENQDLDYLLSIEDAPCTFHFYFSEKEVADRKAEYIIAKDFIAWIEENTNWKNYNFDISIQDKYFSWDSYNFNSIWPSESFDARVLSKRNLAYKITVWGKDGAYSIENKKIEN